MSDLNSKIFSRHYKILLLSLHAFYISVAITHPLLMSRNNTETNQSTVTRNQRANRARRYQYLFSPRNPNPPVILQR